MSDCLETPEELAKGMAERSPAAALLFVVDWLDRRDQLSDQISVEHLAASLEVLAAELRTEAVENLSSETRGLMLAAIVLFDSADGARRGDELAGESNDHGSNQAAASHAGDRGRRRSSLLHLKSID